MTTDAAPPRSGDAASELPPASVNDAVDFVKGLVVLRRFVGLYPSGHPSIVDKVAEMHDLVAGELHRAGDLQIDVIGGVVHVRGVAARHDPSVANVLRDLTDLGIHSIRIRDGLRPDELAATAQFLWEYHDRPSQDSVAARLARLDVEHVNLARIVPLDTRWYSREWPDAPQGVLDPDYEQSLQLAQTTFEDVTLGRTLDPVNVRDLVQLLIHRVARSNAALGHILAVKQYENLTYVHSVNVAMLSLLIGRKVGFDEPTIAELVEAALLHDIGKTRIALDILRKPGPLTTHERRQIELHAMYGAEMLVGLDGLGPLTPTVALEHHRTVRGGGYPALGEGVIPHPMSQIISVADVYEAITGARTHRDPSPPERACLVLARVAGDQLSAPLVKAFVNTITFFPVGSFVRTNLEELAVVIRTHENDPLHPVVAILREDLDGIRAVSDTARRGAGGAYERHVVETVAPPEGAPDLPSILGLESAFPS
jgi:HD-GYP domain-containing protein (c-di-GMP phosphodiesterase class II)